MTLVDPSTAPPQSSGQAALVERLRQLGRDPFTNRTVVDAIDTMKATLLEAADALSTASPAPACASCAEKDAEIGKMARALLRLKRGECWCEMGVGNPNMTSHSSACKTVTAILHGQ